MIPLYKQLFNNLPLIFSDSTDPQDISLNRIMIGIEFLFVIVLAPPLLVALYFYYPVIADKCIPIFQTMFAGFGLHLGINAFKKSRITQP